MKELQEQKQLKIIHKENLQKLSKIKKKERYTLIDLQNLQKVIQNENFQKSYPKCYLQKSCPDRQFAKSYLQYRVIQRDCRL